MKRRFTPILKMGFLIWGAILLSQPGQSAERYYVGEKACRDCHYTQFNKWRLTKHAQAYAALSLPESKEIAKLSGINVEPIKSPICLGCHTTAFNAEKWERDEKFHLEDGVQCEFCHGPGSEYQEENTMRDKSLAKKAGLLKPTESTCMVCHYDKGSHIAVIKIKKFVFETAEKEIAHTGESVKAPQPIKGTNEPVTGPKYVGALVCGSCHDKPDMGYQYGKWRLSPHAQSYVVLSTVKAQQIAKDQGITEDPQKSPVCLKCHLPGSQEPAGRFAETFDLYQGVQCEFCHGAGSEYMPEAVMHDPIAAHKAGLKTVNRETCLPCHQPDPKKPFDFDVAWKKIVHKKPGSIKTAAVQYKTPFNIAVTRDGKRLFVACEASGSLVVVEAETGKILAETALQNQPHFVYLSPDERMAYVSNRGSDSVSCVETATYQVLKTIPVGDEPHEMAADPAGNLLFVANAASYDISVVDLQSGNSIKRLSASRGTWGIAPSPDHQFLYVTNNLSKFIPFRTPSMSEVTVVDIGRSVVTNRITVPEANLVQGIAASPDGEFVLVTLLRTKQNVPMTRVMQGWVITNGIGVLWKDGSVDELLLDEPDYYFADPTDLVITQDGRYAFVSGAGVDQVAMIDLQRLKNFLTKATDKERKEIYPNHLGISQEFVVKRIPVGRNPRGLAVSPDNRFVYVADALEDAISVLDVTRQEEVRKIDLGGPKEITQERFGEITFNNAKRTYGGQFTCHTCHPDGNMDGITYDIEPDGIGVDPVDNRTLRGILDTPPFKWTGKNPSLSRQCGARLAVFFTRIEPFTPEEIAAIDRYICTIPRPPNRFRVGEELTPAQLRGKLMFERTMTNAKKPIPPENRCITCHPAPYYTNRQIVDVGTKSWLDRDGKFDVPQLNNLYETAPYLHDGRADSLEEIWTRFNPMDQHGVTNDMTKDQLNDLVEYLKTL